MAPGNSELKCFSLAAVGARSRTKVPSARSAGTTSRKSVVLPAPAIPETQAHTVRVIVRDTEVLGEVFGRSAAPGAGRELLVADHSPNRPSEWPQSEWPRCPAQRVCHPMWPFVAYQASKRGIFGPGCGYFHFHCWATILENSSLVLAIQKTRVV